MNTIVREPKVVSFGELLLRLSVKNGARFTQTTELNVHIGGAEANVSVLLSQLGIATEFITRLPDNDLARLALSELLKYGVDTQQCIFGGDRMGLYFFENGNQIRQSQVIYDRTNSSFATIGLKQIDWASIFEKSTHFHWSGSSAAVSYEASQVCSEAIQAAYNNGQIISSDFNYRSKLWQYGKAASEIMPGLLNYSTIAVADLDSIEIYFGLKTNKSISDAERFLQAYQFLAKKMPHLKTLAMSFRKSDGLSHLYSAMLIHEGSFFESKQHAIHWVTDQIGSGDAFTAGLLYGLINKLSAQECIEWAVACGVIKQSVHGDFAISSAEEVAHFIKNGSSNRISR
ncbi:sugar kinase [Solitalea longa]|uniref:Sugar kinase n=1 Tax=Solitalea longa TaxID=2079460 RepID=A0A2S4ZYF0_9SPHI|nr:sugar kinase [Solitalea longa]POY35388.1 sugar kinase [Solitalea longa]